MAVRKRTTFMTVRTEGGLLPADLLQRITDGDRDLGGLSPQDYHLTEGERLNEAINRSWSRLVGIWAGFQAAVSKLNPADAATGLTRERWLLVLFQELGYGRLQLARGLEAGGKTFAISHEWFNTPIHLIGCRVDLDKRTAGVAGAARSSPHSLLQEFLNRDEKALWGFVSNGLQLRLLRDNARLTRQAFVEFDLDAMMRGEIYSDFVLLWLICHQSRVETEAPTECWLERWSQAAQKQGARALDKLRNGVEEAIKSLGSGFLSHPSNETLRARLRTGTLSTQDFYRQILRLVYRLLFLFAAEDRDLLLLPTATDEAVTRYTRFYSTARLRTLSQNRRGTRHSDLFQSVRLVMQKLGDDAGCPDLALPALGSFLFSDAAVLDIGDCEISNRALLEAVRSLALTADSSSYRSVDYKNLGAEELGSVYESLLELDPQINVDVGAFDLKPASGHERKTTGSYYTPTNLITHLLDSALDPAITRALRAPEPQKALLNLTVCDPACGSGHFLLASARRVARALASVRSLEIEPGPREYHSALRDVVSHCVYGVDRNPLAVELCKVALWLETHAEGKPLSFLDHRILCGDSLVGLRDLAILHEIPDEAFNPITGDDKDVAKEIKKRNKREKVGYQLLNFSPSNDVTDLTAARRELFDLPDDTPEQVRRKEVALERVHVNRKYMTDRQAANLWCGAFFINLAPQHLHNNEIPTTGVVLDTLGGRRPRGSMDAANEIGNRMRFFHWPLEFPEVFGAGGFDVVVGNPPFLGGLKINAALGEKYSNYLSFAYEPFPGRADLCAAFFRRAFGLLNRNGTMGLVASNSIGQGETREGGLGPIIIEGGRITSARRYIKWPGDATVEVNLVAISKEDCSLHELDGESVPYISSRLDSEPEGEPAVIPSNQGFSFQGSIVLGAGFLLSLDQAELLIRSDPRNADCIFPYLTGEDLNTDPSQRPSRWVIQFDERSETEAQQYPDLWNIVSSKVLAERQTKDRRKYPRMVDEWWKHWNNRRELYTKARRLSRLLARSRISELHSIAFVPSHYVFSEQVIVFAFEDSEYFSLLQSAVHEAWARRHSSTLRTDVRYTPTSCFETFPFPEITGDTIEAREIGSKYDHFRSQTLSARRCGLTSLYNLFHNPNCHDEDIQHLRILHAEMNRVVARWFGWQDIALDHNFYSNERGLLRFVPSPDSREEILRRLLVLNLERTTRKG